MKTKETIIIKSFETSNFDEQKKAVYDVEEIQRFISVFPTGIVKVNYKLYQPVEIPPDVLNVDPEFEVLTVETSRQRSFDIKSTKWDSISLFTESLLEGVFELYLDSGDGTIYPCQGGTLPGGKYSFLCESPIQKTRRYREVSAVLRNTYNIWETGSLVFFRGANLSDNHVFNSHRVKSKNVVSFFTDYILTSEGVEKKTPSEAVIRTFKNVFFKDSIFEEHFRIIVPGKFKLYMKKEEKREALLLSSIPVKITGISFSNNPRDFDIRKEFSYRDSFRVFEKKLTFICTDASILRNILRIEEVPMTKIMGSKKDKIFHQNEEQSLVGFCEDLV